VCVCVGGGGNEISDEAARHEQCGIMRS